MGVAGVVLIIKLKCALTLRETVSIILEYKWDRVASIILIICTVLYFLLPTMYLIGARDQGLYIIHAVNISNNGTMQIPDDVFLRENHTLLKDAINLGYPGIFPIKDNPGEFEPQFLPMFPAALAIGYDLFGLWGLARVNALIGILALLSIYYFARLIFGKITAILAIAFLAVNPAQLWTARITLTELLSQLLFFLSMYIFIFAWRKNSKILSVFAGILIGIGCFNRVDTYMLGPAVFLLLIYVVLFAKEKCKTVLYTAGTMTAFFIVSLLYGYRFHFLYYEFLWYYGALNRIVFLNLGFIAAALAVIFVSFVFLRKKETTDLLVKLLDNRRFQWLISIGMCLLFVFAYFIRPLLTEGGGHDFRSNAMVEFTWYTSFIAIPLAIAGICITLRKSFDARSEAFLFLLAGLSCMLIYIYDPAISPDHIWVSRRWVTVNIPFILIMAAFAVCLLYNRNVTVKKWIPKLTACCCSAVIFVYTGFQTLPFLYTPMLKDFDKQFARIADTLDETAVYFSNDEMVPGILRYVYGINAYWLKEHDNLYDYLKQTQSDTYILNRTNMISFNPQIDFDPLTEHRVSGRYLEASIGSYPKNTYNHVINLHLYKAEIRDGAVDTPKENRLGPASFYSNNSTSDDFRISSGAPGFLAFGPYVPLPAGDYTLTMDLELLTFTQENLGFIDVSANGGTITPAVIDLFASDIYTGEITTITLEFSLNENVTGAEFRLFTTDGTVLQLFEVVIRKG